jgi:hypothetical protein
VHDGPDFPLSLNYIVPTIAAKLKSRKRRKKQDIAGTNEKSKMISYRPTHPMCISSIPYYPTRRMSLVEEYGIIPGSILGEQPRPTPHFFDVGHDPSEVSALRSRPCLRPPRGAASLGRHVDPALW